MKANALLNLHQRQCAILELIIDCDTRIYHKGIDLECAKKERWNNCWYPKNIYWLEDRIERNKAIRQRLISYYKDIQIRIMTLQPEIELNTTTEMDLVTTLS